MPETEATPIGSQEIVRDTLETLQQRYGPRWSEQRIAGLSMHGLFIIVKLASGAQGLCFNYDFAEALMTSESWVRVEEGLMEKVAQGDALLSSILLNRSGDCQPWEQALSVAILSALSQPYLTPQSLAAEGIQGEHGRKTLQSMGPQCRSVLIIGFGGYLPQACKVPHFERVICADFYFAWPDRASFYKYRMESLGELAPGIDLVLSDGSDTEKYIGDVDMVVITGSALSNGSMQWLLDRTRDQAVVVVEGASATILPHAYFKRKVDFVVQSVVDVDLHFMAQRYWRQYRAGDISMGFGYYVDLIIPTFQTLWQASRS